MISCCVLCLFCCAWAEVCSLLGVAVADGGVCVCVCVCVCVSQERLYDLHF